MKTIESVVLAPIPRLLVVTERAFLRHAGREAIITAGLDGRHMIGSLHYKGEAFDFRTRDLRPDQIKAISAEIRAELGRDFDVVVESDHLHVEHDPKERRA